ncbi:MAG: cysteine peptidase family C39 domain-containing protein [Coprobacillus sp.]|nr:cysteine peptidase family C39 domain-containing protein [Coprobacillus sp.]
MRYFVCQETRLDCGFTSLKIILARLNHNKDFLFLPRKSDDLYSFYDLKKSGEKYGLILEGYEYKEKEEIYNAPRGDKILQLDRDGTRHAVILVRIKRRRSLIIDPSSGKMRVKTETLLNEWSGRLLLVSSYTKYEGALPSYPLMKKRGMTSLFLTKLVSSLLLVLGLTTIQSLPAYIPLSLLFGCALVEILYHFLVNKEMKDIDKALLDKLSRPLSSEEELETYEKYKGELLTLPVNISFSGLLCLALIALFIYNSIYNLIIIGALLLFLLVKEVFLSKYLTKKESQIASLERSLVREKDLRAFRSKFLSAHKESYRYGAVSSVYRYIELFTILLSIILSMYLQDILSLTYVLLFFALSYYLLDNLEKVFSIREETRNYRLYKSKYNTMMSRLC